MTTDTHLGQSPGLDANLEGYFAPRQESEGRQNMNQPNEFQSQGTSPPS